MARLDRDKRRKSSHVSEGDEVVMKISAHDWLKHGSMLKGTVTEAPDEKTRRWWREGNGRPMADIVVEGRIADSREGVHGDADWPTGKVTWRYHIDNGYVTGPIDEPNRPTRSDIGRFKSFYSVTALD